MQVIVPLAGKGTRLRPHTHLVPKPLVRVAGRPVMDWVMDRLEGLDVHELIIITGHLKEQVESYVRTHYRYPARFVEQRVQDGTAGAINLARPFVTEPVLVVFVDTVFDADLSLARTCTDAGIIWVKEVEDYQRFGVVVTDGQGYMTRIVEKPKEPISRLANIGLYYVRDVDALWQGIDHVLASPPNRGEYYLTDAFQWMIEHGQRIRTAEVAGWYDCGALATTLETNATLLRRRAGLEARSHGGAVGPGSSIVEPCWIGAGVTIEHSAVGPHVAVERGTVIRGSTVRDAIIGSDCRIERSHLHDALLGDHVVVERFTGSLSVGSHSEVRG
jgi:glucose-1-phosphate thymidylyltransferase